jgi:glycosyltransferase involved in cell wall biosynthesis
MGRELVVLTRPHKTREIMQELTARELDSCVRLLSVPIPGPLVWATKRRRVRIAYLWWTVKARREIRRLSCEDDAIEIVHHVTFATEALPSPISAAPGTALKVFGPAGSVRVPTTSQRSSLRRLHESVHASVRAWVRARIAESNFAKIDVFVANNRSLPVPSSIPRVEVEPNVIVERGNRQKPQCPCGHPAATRVIMVGNLIPIKRVCLGIRAIAVPALSAAHLTIIGDGPLRESLEALTVELGVADRVHFLGRLDRNAVIEHVARADVFFHPSVQEGSGWAAGEAVSVGTPCLVFQGVGVETVVAMSGPESGIALPLTAASNPAAMARAIIETAALRPAPTARWSADRLPGKLAEWYGLA